jgi:hypothetical protein
MNPYTLRPQFRRDVAHGAFKRRWQRP